MIKGINVAHLKEKLVGDAEARYIVVAQKAPNYVKFDQTQDCQALAPSAKLSQDFKLGNITRDEYKRKYTKELELPVAQELMRYLQNLSLIHISEPTRLGMISYAVFCL